MEREQAGRGSGATAAEETGVRIPDLDGRARAEAARASSWDADLITLPGQVETDPGKVVAMVLVAGAGRVLASQVLIGTPSEEQEVIELLENALRHAAGAVGAWPKGIIVRYHEMASVLDERLDHLEVGVWATPDLVELDEVARAMRADMDTDRPVQMDFGPTSWHGWGLGKEWVRSFFEAVSGFAEHAPWLWIPDGYGFSIEAPSGRTWYGMVQWPEHPSGLERGGLFLCADPADHQEAFVNDEGEELWVDRVLGFFLADAESFPDLVLDEIRDAGWEVFSTEAYPFLVTINTPTGGLSRRDAEDLLAAVRVLPIAADEIGGDLKYGEPTIWRDRNEGVTLHFEPVEDWDVEDGGAVHGDEMFPELVEVNRRIQERIEEEGADSLDRVNEITSEEMTAYNRRPQEALGGLSPVQMRLLFEADWDESDGIVRISTDRPDEVLAASRLVRNTRRLLEAIAGEDGISTTKQGNLSRAFAERMREEMEFEGIWASPDQREVGLRSERDLLPLHKVRILAEYADLIRRGPKEFVLTEQGRELLEEERAGDLLKLLLQVHFMEWDLSEWDRYPETPEVQQSVSYMLYRFHQLDETWREADDLLEILLPPGVLEYLEDQFDDTWRLPGLVENRILNPFEAFGLAEKRVDEQEWWLPAEYRPSKLLRRIVSFHFPRPED